ncbi:MAG: FHA domain-containing protein [Anaerolineae bacterium]|nr:FHA domain-containing protein [Anaerolineae bacterium]
MAQQAERNDATQSAERHMARVDLWLEEVPDVDDLGERRLSLERVCQHARAAAEGYVAASLSWGAAEARLAEAIALAALAELDEGQAREDRLAQAVEACQAACAQIGEGGQGQLSLCAGIWAGCAEVLLQVYALSGGDLARRAALEPLVEALGDATGEALRWDRAYRQEGRDALLMAQVAEAVADLEEDPQQRLTATQACADLALTAGAYLQQTGDVEEMNRAYDLIRNAQGALQAARAAAPSALQRCARCGSEQPPGARYCTICGAPLGADAALLGESCLVLRDGPDAGRRHALRDGLAIGRSADNDVVLAMQLVSRHHAVLRRTGEGYAIVDLGSSNGTRVNGTRIERSALLRDGDTIAIGGLELTVQLAPGAAAPAVCPSCGEPVAPGCAFCVRCGARLA